jgi:DNA-binding NarL/FixJ family response regulator
MEMTLRIAVVDDDPLVRAGLRLMLSGDPTIDIVGEAADGGSALDMISREAPHVVLMDIRMPGMDGLSATRVLQERGDSARVIVLTTFDADDMVLTALRNGAAGFLLKDTSPADLVAAVRRVAKGEPMLSPTVTAQLIATIVSVPHDRRREALASLQQLTEREMQVAIAISSGLSNVEIATDLLMGVATVKTHVGHVFAKLGVTNRVQIARCIHDAGLG